MSKAAMSGRLLVYLNDHADVHGFIKQSITEIAAALGMTKDDVIIRCWSLQKLSILTFQERHGLHGTELTKLRFRKGNFRRVGKEQIIFDMALEAVATVERVEAEVVRRNKLEQASKLLEEVDEIELAVLALEAIDRKNQRPGYYDHLTMRPSPNLERLIRRLSPEEIERIGW